MLTIIAPFASCRMTTNTLRADDAGDAEAGARLQAGLRFVGEFAGLK